MRARMISSPRKRLLAFVLALAACKGDGADPKASSGETPIVAGYLAIGDKLASDDASGLTALAKPVVAAGQGDAAVQPIVDGASALTDGDLEAARTTFKGMSDAMIAWMRAHPDTQKGKMIVHCPMTFQGKGGLWVQPEGP